MDKRKYTTLPRNAFRYYANMYFKWKASKETKYRNQWTEAHKSWLSLSESERQLFQNQYNEYKTKHLGNCIKEVEPFMKRKKGVRRVEKLNTIASNQQPETLENITEMISHTAQNEQEHNTTVQAESEKSMPTDDNMLPEHDVLTDTNSLIQLGHESNEQGTMTPSGPPSPKRVTNGHECQADNVTEPAPPSVKTGRELYSMLKSMEKDTNASWAALPKTEKHRYNRATFLLKKDYITKYKQYLESLTPKELFEYYNKTIF